MVGGTGGVGGVGVVEDGLAVCADGVVVAAVDAGGGVVADAGVVVVVVVGEERVDEGPCVGEAGEAFRDRGVCLRVLNWASENGLSWTRAVSSGSR